MRVLVTGSSGFVGSATFADLYDVAYDVIPFDVMGGRDIRDYDQLVLTVDEERPDRILHLAAIARFADADADPYLAHETNVLGTANVVRVAEEFHVPIVYASTGSVYMPIHAEPPITEEFRVSGNSVYGCTKLLGELYVRKARVPWIILRYAHLYGNEKRQHGLIGGFLDRIERGLAPVLYGGRQSNDFTYIADVARANRLALDATWDNWNQVYNIGTGEELSAEDAGKAVCEAFGYQGNIVFEQGREVDAQRFVYDCTKADRRLGFRAEYTFAQGLADMSQSRMRLVG